MNIKNKTILITGGGSGIGFETAKLLSADNNIIIAGRNKQKLDAAASKLKNTVAIQADITDENDVNRLVDEIKNKYGDLSVLINNAGIGNSHKVSESPDVYSIALAEFMTNYFAPLRLVEKLLPVLRKQPEAAIVNVTSVVALTPWLIIPTYSDSKAALRFYTQILRHELKNTNIKVFELLPPLVDTELTTELGGKQNGISPVEVAEGLLQGLETDNYEIPVGQGIALYNGFFSSSKAAFAALNQLG
ncbi:short-chain dehydrogenase [Arachidicoccus ginsenosidimutans]|uniref:SDR family oxidoreductase n=1 Tax=Arachidicoccus sp. BS20 TaxID=1850526 RepID=UPI0007F0858F|nr:SDR family NAD(P)-dependent oxidoreductase [Arachidicoccus sp. BS20]ANI90551.1 short-chain dehydrogenase [Arachidicoccus sp. BS20]